MYLHLVMKALVWFATHFRKVAEIMGERNGVVNLHLAVDVSWRRTFKRENICGSLTSQSPEID